MGIRDRFGWTPPSETMVPKGTASEGLEQLWDRGVIDLVDFYFLLLVCYGETVRHAARFIGLPEETGRERLERARNKVREHLRELEEGLLLEPVS